MKVITTTCECGRGVIRFSTIDEITMTHLQKRCPVCNTKTNIILGVHDTSTTKGQDNHKEMNKSQEELLMETLAEAIKRIETLEKELAKLKSNIKMKLKVIV